MTDTRPFEEMNTIAKQIKEQALVATDDYFKFLKKTISSHPARGSEVGDILKSHAEKKHRFSSGICAYTQRREGFSGRLPSANRVRAVTIRGIWRANKNS